MQSSYRHIAACTVVATQQANQQTRFRGNEHARNNRRTVFSVGSAPRLYNEELRQMRDRESCVEAGSNTSTVALRAVGGDEKGEPNAWNYH
jgi:hypothetical protein